jgi:hypothetical protein
MLAVQSIIPPESSMGLLKLIGAYYRRAARLGRAGSWMPLQGAIGNFCTSPHRRQSSSPSCTPRWCHRPPARVSWVKVFPSPLAAAGPGASCRLATGTGDQAKEWQTVQKGAGDSPSAWPEGHSLEAVLAGPAGHWCHSGSCRCEAQADPSADSSLTSAGP